MCIACRKDCVPPVCTVKACAKECDARQFASKSSTQETRIPQTHKPVTKMRIDETLQASIPQPRTTKPPGRYTAVGTAERTILLRASVAQKCLIPPATKVGGADGSADIDCVLSTNIACGIVVADGVLVQGRTCNAADNHVAAAVDRNAANAGSTLPENLRKMANIVEDFVRKTGLTEVRQHRLEFALVPALSDTGRHVEILTRDGEQVLALAGAGRNVMRKVASSGSFSSSIGNSLIPN